MKKDDCYYLGKITKAHGLKGQVNFYLDVDNPYEYEGLDAVFVEMDSGLMPIFIENLNISAKKVIATLEDHEHIDDVQYLINKSLYLPQAALPELEEDQFYYHEIVGYKVIDEREGDVGEIEDVLEYPQQALIQMDHNGSEVLFPVKDEIIKKVDKKEKIMYVDLPEGLLEIND